MNDFARITRAGLKDCFFDNNDLLTFVVPENDLGRAIDKRGFKVKLLEKATNRKIKILEFNSDPLIFIKNLVFPLKIAKAEHEGKIITLEAIDSKTRGLLIGRAGINLRNYESVLKRYFDIEELRVG